MFRRFTGFLALLAILAGGLLQMAPLSASAATAEEIDADVYAALKTLYAQVPGTSAMAEQSKGVLVFPNIVKAGFVVGAQYGQGALVQGGKIVGYYSIKAASYGLQAGVQGYGYALFLMSDNALAGLTQAGGWELGVGPSIAVFDAGMAKNFTTRTVQDDVWATVFSQTGLMAGAGLQGSKITRLDK